MSENLQIVVGWLALLLLLLVLGVCGYLVALGRKVRERDESLYQTKKAWADAEVAARNPLRRFLKANYRILNPWLDAFVGVMDGILASIALLSFWMGSPMFAVALGAFLIVVSIWHGRAFATGALVGTALTIAVGSLLLVMW